MWIKYTGHERYVVEEYNGKKYVFGKDNPVVDIPAEAYQFFAQSRSPNLRDIVPCNPPIGVMKDILKDCGYSVCLKEEAPKSEEFSKRKPGRPKGKK